MIISIIAAIGKNRELGKNNKLLWHIPEDFKRFKNLTSGHVVIMGRKTYESLPEKFRPLPDRVNIVVTRNASFTTTSQLIVAGSIEQAIDKAKRNLPAGRQVFIIGGANIYEQGIKYANKLYLTLINKAYSDADVFFPDYSEFKKLIFEKDGVEGDLKYKFVELIK
jgi:dihydrofolate reductase